MKSLLVGLMMAYYNGSTPCDVANINKAYRKLYIPASSVIKLDQGRIVCEGFKGYDYCVIKTNTSDDYITATKCDVVANKLNEGLK